MYADHQEELQEELLAAEVLELGALEEHQEELQEEQDAADAAELPPTSPLMWAVLQRITMDAVGCGFRV